MVQPDKFIFFYKMGFEIWKYTCSINLTVFVIILWVKGDIVKKMFRPANRVIDVAKHLKIIKRTKF